MAVKVTTTLVVETSDVAILDGTDVQARIDALNEAKRLVKAAEKAEAEAKAALKALLGEARTGTLEGVVKVTLVEKVRRGVNRELLETAYPDAYAACGTETHYTELRTF